jgi:hypothetical protein
VIRHREAARSYVDLERAEPRGKSLLLAGVDRLAGEADDAMAADRLQYLGEIAIGKRLGSR